MLVTKHAAELCALLVNDLHGELPSRILIALLNKGRCTITQLIQHTSLNGKQIRNGLAVLFQHNLLYTRIDPDTRVTSYDANPTACYSLLRSGKILGVIDRQFGSAERELVQTLLQLGHARIHDLYQAFAARNANGNGHTNGTNGHHSGRIESSDDMLVVLARLIQADLVETVAADSFRNPDDVFHEIKDNATRNGPGEAASRIKTEHEEKIFREWRAFRDKGKSIKRQLDQTRPSGAKRRKLHNGRAMNGDFDEESVPRLNPNIIVRVNHEKCLVELRNRKLADFAADSLGEATGEVYYTLLSLLTADLSRCRQDVFIGIGKDDAFTQPTTTTLDIYEHLDDSINLTSGIGKVSKQKLDVSDAERVRPNAPQSDDESDESDDDEDTAIRPGIPTSAMYLDDDGDDANPFSDGEENGSTSAPGQTNGDRQTKVTFKEEEKPTASRLDQMRQHLLLLTESKHRFIRHCGAHSRGQWTVDFEQLMQRLQEVKLDAVIEQSFDRHGLRLTRILREKGKLDEKLLYSAALMRKADVQGKMLAMQMAGIVDIQEVPKDTSKMANRTMFFWYFDGERTRSQLMDDVYKAILRCMQTLQVERHKNRNILSFVERKDVQGKEEEVMTTEHYNMYNQHLDLQERLLGQVSRLDDMVAVFRDF